MNPLISFLVFSANGDAAALARVGFRRATELGLAADVIHATEPRPPALRRSESITILMPSAYAGEAHEAWCLVCQLALLRAEVAVNILVVGEAGCTAFETHQARLLADPPPAASVRPRRRSRASAA